MSSFISFVYIRLKDMADYKSSNVCIPDTFVVVMKRSDN